MQATLAALQAPNIHDFILNEDRAALNDCDEDGEHAPLLLTTLDLLQWTLILTIAIKDKAKGLEQLKIAHTQLADILDYELEAKELAEQNARLVDAALKRANPHEGNKVSTSLRESSPTVAHPLLNGIETLPGQAAALEDLASSIMNSWEEKATALLVASGKGPVVPLTPVRTVEEMVSHKDHHCWGLRNINLLAPISIPMWKTWANVSTEEVEVLKTNAVYKTRILKDGVDIPNAFALSMFDHNKCQSTDMRIHTKQELKTTHGRDMKFSSTLWNI